MNEQIACIPNCMNRKFLTLRVLKMKLMHNVVKSLLSDVEVHLVLLFSAFREFSAILCKLLERIGSLYLFPKLRSSTKKLKVIHWTTVILEI